MLASSSGFVAADDTATTYYENQLGFTIGWSDEDSRSPKGKLQDVFNQLRVSRALGNATPVSVWLTSAATHADVNETTEPIEVIVVELKKDR